MGLTYRKSVRFGKFFRVNFSKRGPSVSFGPRGAKINIGADGKERFTMQKGGFRYVKTTTIKPHGSEHSSAAPIEQEAPAPEMQNASTTPIPRPAGARSVPVAYLCFILLGAHYLYLSKTGMQILFWLTIGGMGVWALVDLFRIPGMVRDYNVRAEEKTAAAQTGGGITAQP